MHIGTNYLGPIDPGEPERQKPEKAASDPTSFKSLRSFDDSKFKAQIGRCFADFTGNQSTSEFQNPQHGFANLLNGFDPRGKDIVHALQTVAGMANLDQVNSLVLRNPDVSSEHKIFTLGAKIGGMVFDSNAAA